MQQRLRLLQITGDQVLHIRATPDHEVGMRAAPHHHAGLCKQTSQVASERTPVNHSQPVLLTLRAVETNCVRQSCLAWNAILTERARTQASIYSEALGSSQQLTQLMKKCGTHSKPVSQAHTHVHSQVGSVHAPVQCLCLVILFQVQGYVCVLLQWRDQTPQLLHHLNALNHKCPEHLKALNC